MHFQHGQLKVRIICDCHACHGHTLFIRGAAFSVLLVWWISGRHEQYFFEIKLLAGLFCDQQVTNMDGIEGSTHDPYFSFYTHICFLHR